MEVQLSNLTATPSPAAPAAFPRKAPTTPLRVVFCTDSFDLGGTELNAVRTAERFDPAHVSLSVVAFRPEGELRARYDAAGIPVLGLPMANLYGAGALAQGARLAEYLRRERVDIVHCHDIYSNIFGAFWARIAGRRAVIVSRRWWHSARPRKLTLANRGAYRLAHHVLVNSEAVRRSVEREEGVTAKRITVIPNFVEEDAFATPSPAALTSLRQRLGVAGGPVIGIVARLAAVKDHATLLRAVRLLVPRWPGLRVAVVGSGPEREALGRLAAELGIANAVVFAGAHPNRPNLHHAFDVSVLCSKSEGFPNSVVEAMAAGRPVVATRVGGTPDAVLDEATGLLVPPSDPDALAGALGRLLAEPALAIRLGEQGRASARERFGESAVLGRLDALYNRLAHR
ncbi:MAG TPA: glycosyltransferase [Gemmatimonadales bacterium]|nr:glycosyltransferase [Gemmatimonadales bacterium]